MPILNAVLSLCGLRWEGHADAGPSLSIASAQWFWFIAQAPNCSRPFDNVLRVAVWRGRRVWLILILEGRLRRACG